MLSGSVVCLIWHAFHNVFLLVCAWSALGLCLVCAFLTFFTKNCLSGLNGQKPKGCNQFIPDSIVKKRNNSIHCIDHFKIAWFQYKNEYIIWYNLAMWRRPGADQAQIKRRPTEIHGEMHVKWSRLHFLRMLTFMGCRTLPMLNWIAFRNVFAPGLRLVCAIFVFIDRNEKDAIDIHSWDHLWRKERRVSMHWPF